MKRLGSELRKDQEQRQRVQLLFKPYRTMASVVPRSLKVITLTEGVVQLSDHNLMKKLS